MARPHTAFSAGVAAIVALGGCAEHVHVVSAAPSDAFEKRPYFVVLPIDDAALRVAGAPEAAYVAKLDASHRALYPDDKKSIGDRFVAALAGRAVKAGLRVTPAARPDGSSFVIRPALRRLEPGYFGQGWVEGPSRTEMVVRITTPDGRLLDELALDAETDADDLHPTSGRRWRADADEIGAALAAYLKKRVYGE